MPDCDYCGATFDEEDAYLAHLREEHGDELGPIDRRRVDEADEADGIPLGPLALGGVVVVAAAVVAYVVFVAGGAGDGGGSGDGGTVNGIEVAQTPTGPAFQGVHYHGTITMTVTGDRVDFSRQRYQLQADAFHFENPEGTVPYRWHAHAPGITLEYAMATLGIHVTDDSVTFAGTTYTDGEGYRVVVAVDDEDVDPAEYVLKEGDRVRIVVEQR